MNKVKVICVQQPRNQHRAKPLDGWPEVSDRVVTMQSMGEIGARVLLFLSRPGAKETWVYERRIILLVEALCLLAVLVAAPAGLPTVLLLLRAPLQIRKAASDHAARSGAARRREREEAMGRDPVKLSCAKDLEREAQIGQLITAAMPIVDLAGAWALAGGKSIAAAAIVGAACSFVRFGLVEGYGAWRCWYRTRRPLVSEV